MSDLKKIPVFATEQEECDFWESEQNDSTEYFDWSKAQFVSFPNLKGSKDLKGSKEDR